ncbi:MAG: hypothetical protein HOG49_21510 [Candidatus Scalindua sp.]|jgi:hypothetical protein|nr:hypothetical protein [Candidatus Scalindua sp.]
MVTKVSDGIIETNVIGADTTKNLTVGHTTDVEILGSNTITPDMATESLKKRAVNGNVTINFPTNGNSVCHIRLEADSGGAYTVTLGANVNPVGTIPDLSASTDYLAVISRFDATTADIQIQEIG